MQHIHQFIQLGVVKKDPHPSTPVHGAQSCRRLPVESGLGAKMSAGSATSRSRAASSSCSSAVIEAPGGEEPQEEPKPGGEGERGRVGEMFSWQEASY